MINPIGDYAYRHCSVPTRRAVNGPLHMPTSTSRDSRTAAQQYLRIALQSIHALSALQNTNANPNRQEFTHD